ncbi:putative 6-phosphogluconolactonase [Myxozyma melibiosi]|uniref:6-phosphogluconolactonase-like protein n=1 Tax=Myxozyma melibiosi TaxID=54550 RepID=A0ABR1FFV3_9ASCO
MPSLPLIYVFQDADDMAPALADYVLSAQTAALQRHDAFKIGVSGGSLVANLNKALLHDPKVEWGKWHIFFADERLVPLDSPDSNYGLLKSGLLDQLPEGTPQPIVHGIDVTKLDDSLEIADAYEKDLIKSFAAKDSVRLPAFDLLLLGCGPDGHTCSLFPGHELLRENIAWVAPIEDSPKPPPRRITLTLPVVTQSLRIAFVAVGESKAPVLKTVFENPEEGLPCSLVNEGARGKVTWFVDTPAVKGVAVQKKEYKPSNL